MNFDEIDRTISNFMGRWGTQALRISLGVIFIWFGILKPLGISAAEPLVIATVRWLPLFEGELWVAIIGWWEVTIGIAFLFRRTIRIAIALLALQMLGTFTDSRTRVLCAHVHSGIAGVLATGPSRATVHRV